MVNTVLETKILQFADKAVSVAHKNSEALTYLRSVNQAGDSTVSVQELISILK